MGQEMFNFKLDQWILHKKIFKKTKHKMLTFAIFVCTLYQYLRFSTHLLFGKSLAKFYFTKKYGPSKHIFGAGKHFSFFSICQKLEARNRIPNFSCPNSTRTRLFSDASTMWKRKKNKIWKLINDDGRICATDSEK